MRRRALGAVAVAALAISVLAGCQSKIGQAAVVGGHRISDSEVVKYVTKTGPTDAVKSAAAQQGQSVQSPRFEVLNTLIQQLLFITALDRSGGVPSQSQLASLHDETVQRFFQSTITGAQFDAALVKQAPQYGYTGSFATLVIHAAELEDAYANRIKASSTADLVKALAKLHIPVSVSRRYGTWDLSQLSLSTSPQAGLPSVVTFGPGATADANQ